MNKLKIEKQESAIAALVEGASIRSVERMTGIHRDTIMRLTIRTGEKCRKILDQEMHNLKCKRIQLDEIWGYVGKKQRRVGLMDDVEEVGDQWIFVALNADTKLIPSYIVGKRTAENALALTDDLSSRLTNRVQISSDALKAYVDAVDLAFGGNVDYGQIVKSFEGEPTGAGRYSPPQVVSVTRKSILGNPQAKHISTSFVERSNLTMRMSMRRLTRLTNAFSKKLDNLKAATALHFAHYNFVRIHQTLKVTPAMAAGVTNQVWSIRDLID